MTSVSVRTVSAPTAVTTGPIQGSGKRYAPVPGWEPMVFPVRRIGLTNGEHLDVYDTSGPYTDPSAVIDVHAGLPRTRGRLAAAHPDLRGRDPAGVGAGRPDHPGDGVLRRPGGPGW
jgi:hypothetical protein